MGSVVRRAKSGGVPGRRPSRAFVLTVAAAVAAGLGAVVFGGATGAAPVGAGSYTETLPAGASLPVGCGDLSTNPRQFMTANAPAGPVPTNDWWSSLVFKKFDCAFSENLHAHPTSYDTTAGGLGFSYNTTPQISGSATGVGEYHYIYQEDFTAGVAGLNAPRTLVDGWTDWTVTPYWSDGTRTMKATIGHGLPFAYFQITGGNAQITTKSTPTVWSNSGARIGYSVAGRDYVAYAPTGATWSVSGTVITSTLAGRGYFSIAVLPTTPATSVADKTALATSYGTYAHNHVTGTRVSYAYNQNTSRVATTYAYTTTAREGSGTGTVIGLYPHQWRALTGATPIAPTYVTARGTMKNLVGVSSFVTSAAFTGVLPEVPAVADSTGADLATLNGYLDQVRNNPVNVLGNDTYWTGKALGVGARIAEIADQLGRTDVRDTALAAIRAKLTDWFTASQGKTQRLFYYDRNWGTLIGYPASYGSDAELNDHHFHYGYFIAAAATLAKFDPSWAANSAYGGLVDLLIRDANNYDRGDNRFPYLRDFDIYAGHDWAAGHGAFFAGNNQESSSEGMNFANALIQWGQATGNTAIRDAGIFIWTTQSAAINEYWFDTRNENFPSAFGHGTVGMVWGDGGAYATWFSAAPEQIQGINMLPVTGGHFYLGNDPAYVRSNYAELVRNAGREPALWQDIAWQYLALGDGDAALAKFRANSGYTPEEGETKAHTFHWIRNLAALGTVDLTVTANHPLYRVFIKNGARTYVASNITNAALTVTFSDGKVLAVPAGRTVASGAVNWSGGNATGGGINPSPSGSSSPSSPSPSASQSSSAPPTGGGAVRYLQTGGVLAGAAGSAGTATVVKASGVNDNQPHSPTTFTATGLNLTYRSGVATAFGISVDAGTSVGNATQVRVSYDLTGDGSFDRVETFRYFATDPVTGWERYTDGVGQITTTGSFGNLANGTVKVEIWSAIGSAASTVSLGALSTVTLPYQ
ncbi:glycosyl hydrolase [Virgisporangium aurantiacum]|uniref:glycosyl hydrolase n=1 Tax=Virgisporangium aurantiacum TaxID=175570 RepID=UPI00194E9320|nr:glycosyl hydrolase [Virgisporangium aurantiacum]